MADEKTPTVDIPDYWEDRKRSEAAALRQAAEDQQGYMAAMMDAPEGSEEAAMIAEGAPVKPAEPITLTTMPFVDAVGNPVDEKGNPREETPLQRALRGGI